MQLQSVVTSGVDLILPPRCSVTGEIVDVQGMISAVAWADLQFISEPFCEICGIPFEFESGSTCMSCIDAPPPYDVSRSALIYNNTSRDLILGFKHGDKTHVVRSFIPWLQKFGAELLAESDFLIPVPLHPYRLILRRYNQAALIANDLSKKTSIPHLSNAMRRRRATVSQGHLSHEERQKNVRKAFDIHPKFKELIKGKVIVLIDDVYTTGATVKECSTILKENGASKVYVLTLARVLKL